jgi:hypothetical protein
VTIGTSVLGDVGTGDPQSLDIDTGSIAGGAIVGLVYRNGSGDCYFQHTNSSMVGSSPVKFTTQNCYNPTVHFNPATNRFVVTYAELNAAASTYDIKSTEFTIGSTDTNTTPVVIVTGLSTYPIRLVTDFYSAGSWMALFYRLFSNSTLVFHGYHVSGR